MHAAEWSALGEDFDSPIWPRGIWPGERWVFIDWDASEPSTRLGDLAYAAQAFRAMTRRISARSSTATRPLPAMIERIGPMHGLLDSPSIRGVEA
ncbi:hypothetical protein ACT3UD_07425 [Glutamicibacter sp. 287]|uniref:hypothetical protein n=1 Tax=Micrococcaceae TaxID=1268 RepID=UPI0020D0801E|nr:MULTISPECIES: hypothetical protein [Micrococcaceae]